MKASQTSIFIASGSSLDEIEQSPFLERLLARGYEVLYMIEPVDEMLVQRMPGYNGKMFVNVAKGELKFGDENPEDQMAEMKVQEQFAPLAEWLKVGLSAHIDKVTISKRLTTSPMAIVASDHGWTGRMERLMQAQAFRDKDDYMFNMMSKLKKTLEINPKHPLILRLLSLVEDGEVDDEVTEMVTILYDTTSIRSGYSLKDVAGFTQRVETVVRKKLDLDLDVQAEVDVGVAMEKTAEEIAKDEEMREKGDEVVREIDERDGGDSDKIMFEDA